MRLTVAVDLTRANAKIRAMAAAVRRPLRDVLESGARVAAIECARTSQPFGTGAEALIAGTKAVAKDISKVYKTVSSAYADIDERLQAAFWKAYRSGDLGSAQQILNTYGNQLRNVPIGTFDGGAAHKTARDQNTGRVYLKQPKLIVTDWQNYNAYVTKRQGKVGFGKGAWSDVARQISGNAARGLKQQADISARWITRHGAGLGRVYRTGTEQNPEIRIASSVRYASQILRGSGLNDAKYYALYRMLQSLQYALDAEMKKFRAAA